jgi:hypothetical protein
MGLCPKETTLTKVRRRVDSITHYPTLKLKVGQKSKVKVLYKIESPSRGSMESKKIVQDEGKSSIFVKRSIPRTAVPVVIMPVLPLHVLLVLELAPARKNRHCRMGAEDELVVAVLWWCHLRGRRERKVREVVGHVKRALVVSVVVVGEVEERINGVLSEWRQGRSRWWSDVKEETLEAASREGRSLGSRGREGTEVGGG